MSLFWLSQRSYVVKNIDMSKEMASPSRTLQELSRQERDQLDRSMKKAKVVTSTQDTGVPESPSLDGVDLGATNPMLLKQNAAMDTTIGMPMQRREVSYKDAILQFNGGSQAKDVSDDEDWFAPNKEFGGLEEEGMAEDAAAEDQEEQDRRKILVPMARVTREEIQEACQPWKQSLIVKLMGKRLGLPFLKARLTKLWEPRSAMEMIDLNNDYFLIRFGDLADVVHILEGAYGWFWVIISLLEGGT